MLTTTPLRWRHEKAWAADAHCAYKTRVHPIISLGIVARVMAQTSYRSTIMPISCAEKISAVFGHSLTYAQRVVSPFNFIYDACTQDLFYSSLCVFLRFYTYVIFLCWFSCNACTTQITTTTDQTRVYTLLYVMESCCLRKYIITYAIYAVY